MEEVIPWTALLEVIAPHYPKGDRGRRPMGLQRMLRVYFLQQWYALGDEAPEDTLYDSHALQRFARIELDAEGVPDATTLLKFRRLLETHDLCKAIFAAINVDLAARGLLLREGTLVDATLIAAPSSTKNAKRERDPAMHQTKKGNQWYFGMKAHIGADWDGGGPTPAEPRAGFVAAFAARCCVTVARSTFRSRAIRRFDQPRSASTVIDCWRFTGGPEREISVVKGLF